MPYRNDDRFGSDLYEGDWVLFIHDSRKCRAKISLLVLVFGCWIGLGVFWMIALFAESNRSWFDLLVAFSLGGLFFLALPPTWCAIILALQTWWGIKGQQTLRIDGRQIRHDWWGPWGHGCKSWVRDRVITVTAGPGDEMLASRGVLELQIGKTRVRFHLVTMAEAEWLCEKVNRFRGLHLDLRDGSRVYLPMVSVPQQQRQQQTQIMAGILFIVKKSSVKNRPIIAQKSF